MTTVAFEVGLSGQVVPIDLYTGDLALVGNVLSSESLVTLNSGTYIAVARDADGREMRASFEVLPGSRFLQVDLRSAPLKTSRRAWWALVLRTITLAGTWVVRRVNEPVVREYWCSSTRGWKLHGKPLRVSRWLGRRRVGIDAIVLSARGQPRECVRAPRPAWDFLTAKLSENARGRPELDVRLKNTSADALLRSLDAGELGRAEALTRSQALSAENLLGSKRGDPVAAVAGGYALLRLGEIDRLHDWTGNLRSWFPWLPDGLVIHAEFLARRGQHRAAAAELCELAERGVPVFSTGVSFAADRLRLYARAWPNNLRVADALTYLSKFSVAVDFTRPITTFTCRNPDEPVVPAPRRRTLSLPRPSVTGLTFAGIKETLRRLATMDKARMVFAAVVTVIFIAAAILLISRVDSSTSDQWARLVYVFGAFEAIAFTAVGWVFGAEVNRQRADSAEERANKAAQDKDTEAEKGRTLAGLVVGRGSVGQAGRQRLETQGETAGTASDPAVDYARSAYNINI